MQPFRCSHCQSTVFFENDHCVNCGATLGYVPGTGQMRAFQTPAPATDGAADNGIPFWTGFEEDAGPALRPCNNRLLHAACNWMLDEGDKQPLCRSCRLTRVIPALDLGRNRQRWLAIEQAKRRLVYTLIAIGLAPEPKTGPDDKLGLEFLLLEHQPGEPPVHTGHDDGTITLNVSEADDEQREALRVQLGEPMRTLLGHLRHETSHYLQYRWIDNTPSQQVCRDSFGDERADYTEALAQHYQNGAPADWPQRFVSAYASAHPWEDWAETCAHYLLVLDVVQTASSWGLSLQGPAMTAPQAIDPAAAPPVGDLVLQQWLPVAQFLNAMNRSLGLHDSYPFLLPPAVLDKMAVVQSLLSIAAAQARQGDAQQQGAQQPNLQQSDVQPPLPPLDAVDGSQSQSQSQSQGQGQGQGQGQSQAQGQPEAPGVVPA